SWTSKRRCASTSARSKASAGHAPAEPGRRLPAAHVLGQLPGDARGDLRRGRLHALDARDHRGGAGPRDVPAADPQDGLAPAAGLLGGDVPVGGGAAADVPDARAVAVAVVSLTRPFFGHTIVRGGLMVEKSGPPGPTLASESAGLASDVAFAEL